MQLDVWWGEDLRSPHDMLGGVKMLAREVDKLRAELSGRSGRQSDANEAALDELLFSCLGVSRTVLSDVVRRAWSDCRRRNDEALIDLREAAGSEPEITDAQFIQRAQASDIDNAVVRWVHETLNISAEAIGAINAAVDRIVPNANDAH